MIGLIEQFVTHPMFKIILILGVGLFIIGGIGRFGLHSIKALSCGIYDVSIILFIFLLSLCAYGVDSAEDAGQQIFSSLMPDVFGPVFDLTDAIHGMNGFSDSIIALLYRVGMIFILAIIIEIMETVTDIMRIKSTFMLWWFSEATTTVVAVFAFSAIKRLLESYVPREKLEMTVAGIFALIILCTIISGILSVFGPLGFLLDFSFTTKFLTSLVTSLIVFIFALLISGMGWIEEIKAFNIQYTMGLPAETLFGLSGLLCLLWLLWYVLCRALRA